MSVGEVKIKIAIRKRWFYYPYVIFIGTMVSLGYDMKRAADDIARGCFSYKVEK